MVKINKSELNTNETPITKVDKNRLQLGLHKSPYAGNYSLKKHKTKVTLKILSKITCLLLPCKWLKLALF